MEADPVVCAVEPCQLRTVTDFKVDGLLLRRGSSLVFSVILIGAGIGEAGEIVRPCVFVIAVLIHDYLVLLDSQAFIESGDCSFHLRTPLPAQKTAGS